MRGGLISVFAEEKNWSIVVVGVGWLVGGGFVGSVNCL